jgi:glycosyltransferase involved in cell wall biosynthesis
VTVTGVAIVSYRLAGRDGVSIEAAKWGAALCELGMTATTVAGEGADVVIPGLGLSATEPPDPRAVENALAAADLVIVDNLLSLPLNPAAMKVVADVLRGRRAVLRHHDLPWQREQFASYPPPPHDEYWQHVTINELSRRQLASRGIDAVTIYNAFDPSTPGGDRDLARHHLGVADAERLVLHPTRAIPRKNVPGALALARAVGATYWLLGPADDGYGAELDALLHAAPVRVLRGDHGLSVADAYAACDAVVYPSTWEGFGNPPLEAAVFRCPVAIGAYPVADELARYGFSWFAADDPSRLVSWFEAPDTGLLERNHAVVRRHFDLSRLPARLERLLATAGMVRR